MRLSVSTNWNSRGHDDGAAIVDDVLATGLDTVELGYSLTHRQAEDIACLQAAGRIHVGSVHAYCPVPMGATSGGPELFTICHRSPRERRRAIEAVMATARFAAEMGAKVVVLHGGRVPIARHVRKLTALAVAGRRLEPRYTRQLERLFAARDRRAPKVFALLRESLRELLPAFEALGLTLALENLPTWDATPNEPEMHQLCEEFPSTALGYWHDIGHGQVRENLGLIHHASVARRLASRLAGMHVHDATGFTDEHLMPPRGKVQFGNFRELAELAIPAVLEPAPGTPIDEVREAVDFLRHVWA